MAEIDYFRLHKFEELKKVRRELRDISDDRRKKLLKRISEEEKRSTMPKQSKKRDKMFQEVLQFEKWEMQNPKV